MFGAEAGGQQSGGGVLRSRGRRLRLIQRAPRSTARSQVPGRSSPVRRAKRSYIQSASPLLSHSPSWERK